MLPKMDNSNVEVGYSNDRLPHESSPEMSCRNQYGIPEDYNPSNHPPVKLRNHPTSSDQSETQRKRRSKNRLSNRRSTGYVSPDLVDEAMKLGTNGKEHENRHKQ